MKKRNKNLSLLKLMILEEFRLNSSMIGRVQFLFFPVFIGIFAFIISVISPIVLHSMSMHRVYFILQMVLIVYGIGVGGFALFAEHIAERRFGQVNILLSTPMTHPVEFKTIFMIFYVKDVIYYFLFSIIPIIAGIFFSIPITHFNYTNVIFLLLTMTLSFLTGISFSFFMSSVYVRYRKTFIAVVILIIAVLAGAFLFKLYNIQQIIPSLMFQYTKNPIYLFLDIILIIIFSLVAVNFIKVEVGKRTEQFNPEILDNRSQFSFMKGYSVFAAKEWLDVRRSRTLFPIIFAYLGPMIFLTVLQWFIRSALALPISFNCVFYATLIGFFSITIYSWFNITDSPDFYQVLPVSVPQIIKTKLFILSLFTYTIAVSFVVITGVLNHEFNIILLAVFVALVNTSYTLLITAYLTGLRTNSYLFDPRVLAKFSATIIPPLIVIIISSFLFSLDFFFYSSVIIIVCVIQLLIIMALPKAINKKWSKATFTI